jgi:hypothetical protein
MALKKAVPSFIADDRERTVAVRGPCPEQARRHPAADLPTTPSWGSTVLGMAPALTCIDLESEPSMMEWKTTVLSAAALLPYWFDSSIARAWTESTLLAEIKADGSIDRSA